MPKYHTNNPHGRKKGVPNKTNKELRTLLQSAFQGEIENIPNTLKKLEPGKRLEILSKFIGYILPKPIETPERDLIAEAEQAEAIRHMVNSTMRPPNVTFTRENMSNEPDV